MDINKAIGLLRKALDEIAHLRRLALGNKEFDQWHYKVLDILEVTFSKSSSEYERFARAVRVYLPTYTKADRQKEYNRRLDEYETALKSIVKKYEILGVEAESAAKTEPPKAPEDYEKKAGKELELILEGTPDMIVECIMNFVKKLNSQGYAYKSIPRIGDAPDYARWDKAYSARCTIVEARESVEKQIGIIRLQLLPNERTLFKIPEPEDWDSPFGDFISHLLAEFQRLGFVYFEKEKPPIGFKLPHQEKNV